MRKSATAGAKIETNWAAKSAGGRKERWGAEVRVGYFRRGLQPCGRNKSCAEGCRFAHDFSEEGGTLAGTGKIFRKFSGRGRATRSEADASVRGNRFQRESGGAYFTKGKMANGACP